MASFRKRGKYWTYRIRIKDFKSEWVEFSGSGYKTKVEAREAAFNKEIELKSVDSHSGKMRFKDYGPLWLENYVKDKLKPNTYKTYRDGLQNHAIPALGNYLIRDIRPIMYQKFIDNIMDNGLSKSTARRIHNSVNQCMKRACMDGYITKNPCENVVIKKLTTKKLKFVEPDLVPSILAYIYRRDYTYGLFFETLFESGMRKGECAALQLDDIMWQENQLRVDQTLDFQPEEGDDLLGTTKTYTSTRSVQMREKYIQKLKTYLKYRMEQKLLVGELYNKELNLVFARDDGTPLPKSTLWNVFKSALDHVGYDKVPIHSTRHTHVVMLMEAGWDMKTISERLGHESIVTTMNTYAHISNKITKTSIDSFDKYMDQKETI